MKCPDCERDLVEVDGRPSRWCVECEHVITDEDMNRILDAFAADRALSPVAREDGCADADPTLPDGEIKKTDECSQIREAVGALRRHLDDETPFTVMEGIERLALDLNAEHDRAEAAASTLAQLRSDLEGLAEQALTRFAAVDSWGTEREPGRGTSVVIRRSDALHVLLFLRADLTALLTHVRGQPASTGSDEQP